MLCWILHRKLVKMTLHEKTSDLLKKRSEKTKGVLIPKFTSFRHRTMLYHRSKKSLSKNGVHHD